MSNEEPKMVEGKEIYLFLISHQPLTGETSFLEKSWTQFANINSNFVVFA